VKYCHWLWQWWYTKGNVSRCQSLARCLDVLLITGNIGVNHTLPLVHERRVKY
jgi:hypothetical protein